MTLDRHGQPLNRSFNAAMLNDRAIDELIGLCRGVLADGEVTLPEADFLISWMESNRQASERWPARVLYPRIRAMLSDGELDREEQAELLELLTEITGGDLPVGGRIASLSSTLPLDDPAPPIRFERRSFCFTGRCVIGSRKKCEGMVIDRGGNIASAPVRSLNYLVIGAIGSTDWIHSTYGRKIEKAVHYRKAGCPIAIISEEHWAQFVS